MISQKMPDTTITCVRRELQRTCMKISTTAVALITAMVSATMMLSGPQYFSRSNYRQRRKHHQQQEDADVIFLDIGEKFDIFRVNRSTFE